MARISSPAAMAFMTLLALLATFAILTGQIFPSNAILRPHGAEYEKSLGFTVSNSNDVLVGAGKADITGPVVEINMMGYADTAQSGTGLRQRLYTRAFIFGSATVLTERIVYLVLDTQSGDTAVRNGILDGLKELGAEYAAYTKDNIAVTGTHSHSGPGAWLNYLLPQITSKGFDKPSYHAIVAGSILAIKRAHENLKSGSLSFGSSQVEGGNINRSPFAYDHNSKEEKARYEQNTDTEMTQLMLKDADGSSIAALNWHPVHGTSLFQNNTLITGDNKGVAAYMLEQDLGHNFVAGFSQANVGDTSPNTLGAYCEDTGLQCRYNDSTCDGKTQGCHGRGPFYQALDQGTKSCYEIGRRQYAAAKGILDQKDTTPISSPVISSFHIFQDMVNYTFPSPFDTTRTLRTCSAALGYGFAGGTTDGPGAFDFRQGTNDTDDDSPALKNPLWKVARSFIHPPTDDNIACQAPKPILLDVGAAHRPYYWSPNIVDIQMQRIGQLIIIVAPGEATTMAGRRWKEAIASAVSSVLDIKDPIVVLGGPANTYAHYIATEEEYAVQRYEGASTLFGPHTLNAYINLTLTYLPYLGSTEEKAKLKPLPRGPQPPIQVNSSMSFITGVVVDNAGFFRSFGDVLEAPKASFYKAGDVPRTKFVGANPRNNFRLEGTFAQLERYADDTKRWVAVMDDKDWHLVYRWKRTSTVLGTSEVTIEWEVQDEDVPGEYRMRYSGDSKSLGGSITPFEGVGDSFKVVK